MMPSRAKKRRGAIVRKPRPSGLGDFSDKRACARGTSTHAPITPFIRGAVAGIHGYRSRGKRVVLVAGGRALLRQVATANGSRLELFQMAGGEPPLHTLLELPSFEPASHLLLREPALLGPFARFLGGTGGFERLVWPPLECR